MPVKGATILSGPTISASGGTSSSLTLTGAEIKHGLQVADMSVADYRVRPFLNFKTKQPSLVNNVYTKARNEAMICIPKVLANGTISFPLARISFEPHPEQTDAEISKILSWAAQLAFDADFVNFFKYGSLD